jgi:hypothetical protein
MADKLIGPHVYDGYGISARDRLVFALVTPDFSGTIEYMMCRFAYIYDGSILFGIYGSDGSLIATTSEFVGMPTANQTFPLVAPLKISPGSQYYVGYLTNNTGSPICSPSAAGSVIYKSYIYNGSMPTSMGTGWSEFQNRYPLQISGWGTIASGGAGRLIGSKSRLIGGPSPLIGGPSPLIG